MLSGVTPAKRVLPLSLRSWPQAFKESWNTSPLTESGRHWKTFCQATTTERSMAHMAAKSTPRMRQRVFQFCWRNSLKWPSPAQFLKQLASCKEKIAAALVFRVLKNSHFAWRLNPMGKIPTWWVSYPGDSWTRDRIVTPTNHIYPDDFNGCISIFSMDNGAGNSEHPNPFGRLGDDRLSIFSQPLGKQRARGHGTGTADGKSPNVRMFENGCIPYTHKMVVEWGKMMISWSERSSRTSAKGKWWTLGSRGPDVQTNSCLLAKIMESPVEWARMGRIFSTIVVGGIFPKIVVARRFHEIKKNRSCTIHQGFLRSGSKGMELLVSTVPTFGNSWAMAAISNWDQRKLVSPGCQILFFQTKKSFNSSPNTINHYQRWVLKSQRSL